MGDYQEKILPLFAKAMDKALLQKKAQFLEKKLKNHFGFQSTTWISDGINQAKDGHESFCYRYHRFTKKEVHARAIHHQSKCSLRAFLAVNCSSF
jgi:transcriptional regulator of acetoin/glycerol metabolism